MNLLAEDKEQLTNLLHRALDKKQLNSKTIVVYDPILEEIQEIKGLIYHKVATGRTVSQIVEKKSIGTLRRKVAGQIKNESTGVPEVPVTE